MGRQYSIPMAPFGPIPPHTAPGSNVWTVVLLGERSDSKAWFLSEEIPLFPRFMVSRANHKENAYVLPFRLVRGYTSPPSQEIAALKGAAISCTRAGVTPRDKTGPDSQSGDWRALAPGFYYALTENPRASLLPPCLRADFGRVFKRNT